MNVLERIQEGFIRSEHSQRLNGLDYKLDGVGVCRYHDWLLEGDFLALTGETTGIDDTLHVLHAFLDLSVDQLLLCLRPQQEMDTLLVVGLVRFRDHLHQIQEHHISDERYEWAHTNAGIQEHLKQDVQRDGPVLLTGVTLQASAVEADIPVGELLQELEELRDNQVEFVSVHLSFN